MFTAGRRLPIAPLMPTLLVLAAAACAAGGQSGAPPDAAAASPARPPAAATALIEWLRPATLPGVSPPPPAAVPGPGRAAAPRVRVAIDLGGLWVGPESQQAGPRVHYLFARRQRAEDLAQLVRAYAPFRMIGQGDGAGRGVVVGGSIGGGAGVSELVFRGRGAAQASAAERRMIGEWTRAVAVEAAEVVDAAPAIGDGGAPSPLGLAFAWHRGAASGGVCDDLVVYLTGEVRAGACGADDGVAGRLAGERLQRLYDWIDGFAAFQDAGEQELRADALLARLIFAGRGQHRATPRDIAAIETFAAVLHRELTAAAPAAAAPGVAAGPIPRPPAAARKEASPPPGERPEDAAPENEAAAAPADVVPPKHPPRPRQVTVSPEPDEAPPPPAEAVSPPPPQPRPQPRQRGVDAAPAPEAPPPPAAGTVPPPLRPSSKRPAVPAPPPEAPPPPPAA
jgi:hypothetical protein